MSRRRSGGVVTAATGALRTGSAIPGSFWKRKILSGRLADPARPGEVNVSFTLAQRFHLRAGGPLRLALSRPAGGRITPRKPIPAAAVNGTYIAWALPPSSASTGRWTDSSR